MVSTPLQLLIMLLDERGRLVTRERPMYDTVRLYQESMTP